MSRDNLVHWQSGDTKTTAVSRSCQPAAPLLPEVAAHTSFPGATQGVQMHHLPGEGHCSMDAKRSAIGQNHAKELPQTVIFLWTLCQPHIHSQKRTLPSFFRTRQWGDGGGLVHPSRFLLRLVWDIFSSTFQISDFFPVKTCLIIQHGKLREQKKFMNCESGFTLYGSHLGTTSMCFAVIDFMFISFTSSWILHFQPSQCGWWCFPSVSLRLRQPHRSHPLGQDASACLGLQLGDLQFSFWRAELHIYIWLLHAHQ